MPSQPVDPSTDFPRLRVRRGPDDQRDRARHVVAAFRRKGSGLDPSISLTAREEETLVLRTKGYSNNEIAEHLHLSIETVRSHVKSIYTQMHVRSRTEAVAHYVFSRSG